jgi:hypothetical protein
MSQLKPFNGNASVSGPSADVFLVTQAMCEAAITAGLPRGTAVPASPKLPVELRQVEALAECTVTFQSRGGATWERTLAAGDVQLGYLVALTGLSSDTALLGYA